jgi:radical SAM protein with 4Fe4S-binding SPASM domain
MVARPAVAVARRWAGRLRADLAAFRAVLAGGQVASGLYPYRFRSSADRKTVHLRVDPDGAGLLVVDAQATIQLNPTATLLAWLALEGVPRTKANRVLQRCAASRSTADDCRRVYQLLERILSPTECPGCLCDQLDRREPFSTPVRAPLRADLALTYHCNNACGHCYNPPERRRMASLSAAEWRRVLRRVRAAGVPHVIFTGGEPTLCDDLVPLVRYASRLGLVTGVNTNGRRLAEPGGAARLARAGLDHVQITLESCHAAVHNVMTGADAFAATVAGIRKACQAGLHTITNTTLTAANADHALETVDFLHRLGLTTIAMNGMIHSGCGRSHPGALPAGQLGPLLVAVRERTDELGMRLLWYTPTDYCQLSPLELELGPRRCSAAEYSICVEPNGDVLPCQSYYQPAGNLLSDPWERIWNSPLFRSFRNRSRDPAGCGLPERCWDCTELGVCGGGCRLEHETQAAYEGECATRGVP